MNIRQRRAIHDTAANILNRPHDLSRIVLVYTAVFCGLSLLATLLSAFLSDGISGTGGLSNIGTRSILSTGQSVLPLVNLIITGCLGLGYHIAVLSHVRGFEATPRTLLEGFRFFGPLIRALLFQTVAYGIAIFGATYLSSFIFMMTPFSADFMEVVSPMISSVNVLSDSLVLDEATLMAATETMMPMFWILAVVCAFVLIPMHYRFRMVTFCLADDPRRGALFALSKSRAMMRRNCFALFRLDLDLWWFYLGQILVTVVCYCDVLLPLLGITFPWSSTVSFYLFFGLSLAIQFALYYFTMNRVYTVYAVAYETLQEQLPKPNYPVQM